MQHIEVAKLVKARPLDNTEFMQWFKAYFENQTGGRGLEDEYDGPARRTLCKTGDIRVSGLPTAAAASAKPSAGGIAKRTGDRPQLNTGIYYLQRPALCFGTTIRVKNSKGMAMVGMMTTEFTESFMSQLPNSR
jgi:hypothetical protein